MEATLRTMVHEERRIMNNGPDAITLGRSAQGLDQPGERVQPHTPRRRDAPLKTANF